MDNKLPFSEDRSGDRFLRKFNKDIDPSELQWHRDKEDRIIESNEKTDWMIQIDNKIPEKIDGKISIPKEIYHRLIKGNGDLHLLVTKIN